MVWVTLVQDGRDGKVLPLPGVPRVGDLIDMSPGVAVPGGDYVQVVRVIWQLPFVPTELAEAFVREAASSELPSVLVYTQSVKSNRLMKDVWRR